MMNIKEVKVEIDALENDLISKRVTLARLAGSIVTELERLGERDSKEYVRACRDAAALAIDANCWDIAQHLCRKGLEVVRTREVWTYLDYPNMEKILTQIMGKAIVLCDLWYYHQ